VNLSLLLLYFSISIELNELLSSLAHCLLCFSSISSIRFLNRLDYYIFHINMLFSVSKSVRWCCYFGFGALKLLNKFLVHLVKSTEGCFLLKLLNFLLWAGTRSRRHFALLLWWLSLVRLISLFSGLYSSSIGWSCSRLLWGDK
jgi:hypothetical protein